MLASKLTETALDPIAAGASFDVCSDSATGICVLPGETARIPTGLCVAGALVFSRANHALQLVNGTGICHPDRTDELVLHVRNTTSTPFTVYHGERIAQILELRA